MKIKRKNDGHIALLDGWLRVRINNLKQKAMACDDLERKKIFGAKAKAYKEVYEYVFNEGKLISENEILSNIPKIKRKKNNNKLLSYEEIEQAFAN